MYSFNAYSLPRAFCCTVVYRNISSVRVTALPQPQINPDVQIVNAIFSTSDISAGSVTGDFQVKLKMLTCKLATGCHSTLFWRLQLDGWVVEVNDEDVQAMAFAT